jgi:excisionase family DNA binding protein
MSIAMKADAAPVVRPAYGSLEDAAAYTSLSPQTIRRLIDAGKLRSFRVGGRRLVAFSDLDALVRGSADGEPAGTARPEQSACEGDAEAIKP